MRLLYEFLIQSLWIAFLAYWFLLAANVKKTERLEPAGARALRLLLFAAAIVLLCAPLRFTWVDVRLWPASRLSFFAGALITLAGLLFAVWARVHLGRNWSRSVTIKEGHELIVTGPYALVRHPIYAGLLAGFVGTALAIGEVRGVVGFALVAMALLLKLRLEEKWMREQFGAAYAAYAGRVAALVPGVR